MDRGTDMDRGTGTLSIKVLFSYWGQFCGYIVNFKVSFYLSYIENI